MEATQLWRYYYGTEKKRDTGTAGTQSTDQWTAVSSECPEYGRHPESVQKNDRMIQIIEGIAFFSFSGAFIILEIVSCFTEFKIVNKDLHNLKEVIKKKLNARKDKKAKEKPARKK